jgi:hypothetical protein
VSLVLIAGSTCGFSTPIKRQIGLTGVFTMDNHVCDLPAGHFGPHQCWCFWTFGFGAVPCR